MCIRDRYGCIQLYKNFVVSFSDGLEFTTTNLELYRPVVVGETVTIDCATNEKDVNLNLLQLKKGLDTPTVLKV